MARAGWGFDAFPMTEDELRAQPPDAAAAVALAAPSIHHEAASYASGPAYPPSLHHPPPPVHLEHSRTVPSWSSYTDDAADADADASHSAAAAHYDSAYVSAPYRSSAASAASAPLSTAVPYTTAYAAPTRSDGTWGDAAVVEPQYQPAHQPHDAEHHLQHHAHRHSATATERAEWERGWDTQQQVVAAVPLLPGFRAHDPFAEYHQQHFQEHDPPAPLQPPPPNDKPIDLYPIDPPEEGAGVPMSFYCSCCAQILTEPRLLHCGHAACRMCLQAKHAAAKHNGTNTIFCDQCATPTHLDALWGTGHLLRPRDTFLQQLDEFANAVREHEAQVAAAEAAAKAAADAKAAAEAKAHAHAHATAAGAASASKAAAAKKPAKHSDLESSWEMVPCNDPLVTPPREADKQQQQQQHHEHAAKLSASEAATAAAAAGGLAAVVAVTKPPPDKHDHHHHQQPPALATSSEPTKTNAAPDLSSFLQQYGAPKPVYAPSSAVQSGLAPNKSAPAAAAATKQETVQHFTPTATASVPPPKATTATADQAPVEELGFDLVQAPPKETGFFERLGEGLSSLLGIKSAPEFSSTATGVQQAVVYFAPFSIDKENARTTLQRWLASLWFAPNDIQRAQLRDPQPLLIPFYIFEAETASQYNAQVAPAGVDPKSTAARWRPASGLYRGKYEMIALCAAENEEVRKFVVEFFPTWDMTQAKKELSQLKLQPAPPQKWESVWRRHVVSKIQPEEQNECQRALASQNLVVKEVNVHVAFTDVRRKLVYMPLYVSSYVHEGKVYRVGVHGQTGKIAGERPYGMGTLARIGKSITSWLGF